MKKNQTLCIDLEDAVSMHYYTQTLLFDSNTVLNYQIKFYDVELWDNCKTAPSIVRQLCKLKAGLHKTTLVKNLLLQFAVWMSLQSQSQSSDIGQLQLLWGAQPFLSFDYDFIQMENIKTYFTSCSDLEKFNNASLCSPM